MKCLRWGEQKTSRLAGQEKMRHCLAIETNRTACQKKEKKDRNGVAWTFA